MRHVGLSLSKGQGSVITETEKEKERADEKIHRGEIKDTDRDIGRERGKE